MTQEETYRGAMRRTLAGLSAGALTLGLLVGIAPSSQAADIGTVTVSYDASTPTFVSFSPTSLTGGAGDTFTFVNNRYNSVSSYISIENGTGSATMGGTPCTSSTACQVLDRDPPPRSAVVTIANPGTFTIYRFTSGAPTSIGTLTVSGNGSGAASLADPALVYPTLYLNANGGTCTGTMQFTKYNGQNDFVILPTSATCTRSGYTLLGWLARNDAFFLWRPGGLVSIGDESFTLGAMWRADGLEVTYSANVGMNTECVKDGVNQSTSAERSVTRLITQASAGEAIRWDSSNTVRWTATTPTPICSPPGYVFRGWSPTAAGQVPGASAVDTIITTFPGHPSGIVPLGNALTLYAQWGLTWGVRLAASSQSLNPGDSAVITVTALRNGAADTGAPRQLQLTATGSVTFAGGATTTTLTTNNAGVATVTVIGAQTAGSGAVNAAYGDKVEALQFTVASSQPASIVITGERTLIKRDSFIRIEGIATGIPGGAKVIPWIRFPGETSFTALPARPAINVEGEFFWERKTTKRSAVYVTSEDGSVRSNTVTIPAK